MIVGFGVNIDWNTGKPPSCWRQRSAFVSQDNHSLLIYRCPRTRLRSIGSVHYIPRAIAESHQSLRVMDVLAGTNLSGHSL